MATADAVSVTECDAVVDVFGACGSWAHVESVESVELIAGSISSCLTCVKVLSGQVNFVNQESEDPANDGISPNFG